MKLQPYTVAASLTDVVSRWITRQLVLF